MTDLRRKSTLAAAKTRLRHVKLRHVKLRHVKLRRTAARIATPMARSLSGTTQPGRSC